MGITATEKELEQFQNWCSGEADRNVCPTGQWHRHSSLYELKTDFENALNTAFGSQTSEGVWSPMSAETRGLLAHSSTPLGSQPIAGGRAQRKPPVRDPAGSRIPKGFQPPRQSLDAEGCNPFGIGWLGRCEPVVTLRSPPAIGWNPFGIKRAEERSVGGRQRRLESCERG